MVEYFGVTVRGIVYIEAPYALVVLAELDVYHLVR